MTLKDLLNGTKPGTITTSFQVIVVQITVSSPPGGAFKPAPGTGPLGSKVHTNLKAITIGGKTYDADQVVGVPFIGSDATLNPPPAALTWSAQVTLTGPGADLGVNHIVVGFVQHAEITADQVVFGTAKQQFVFKQAGSS